MRDFPKELLASVLSDVRRYSDLPIQLQSDASRRGDLMSLAELLSTRYSLKVECAAETDCIGFIQQVAGAVGIITVDSASAHLAAAFNQRAIILHGDAQPNEFVPWGEGKRQLWVSKSMPCRACNWLCVYDRPICMTGVTTIALSKAVASAFRYD